MTTLTRHRPAMQTGRDGFGQLLRAEWTKLRSVRRWVLGLLAAVVLTLALSLFTAAGSGTDLNRHLDEFGTIGPDGQLVEDEFQLVHQPLTGDGSITVQVLTLTGEAGAGPAQEGARAGIMLKESATAGAPYAAVMATQGQGVRFQSNFTADVAGSEGTAPRWLRLTRTGETITGYESGDGSGWSEVGRVDLDALPPTAQIGLFVTSPGYTEVERGVGSSSAGTRATLSTATFDSVLIEAAQPQPSASWQDLDTSTGFVDGGSWSESGGVFTVTGSGDIGPYQPDEDVTQFSLIGVIFGQIAVIAVAVLFITSEYKRGMIRTTFATSPRRGRVLVAKAIVLGGATFMVGLVASVAAFLITQPVLRSNGFGPPGYPTPSLADATVLRAVVGAAAFLALVAVLSLAVGAILRRSVGAITAMVVILIPATLFLGALPLSAAQWIMRTTPPGGLAITQALEVDHDTAIEPWKMAPPLVGLGALAAWAVATLAVAVWQARRRDA